MATYITIIIGSILGVIGLVAKTKKDDKSQNINALTPFGIIMLLLLLASLGISIWVQHNKDIETENNKKEAKYKSDRDSIINRHNYEFDSINRMKTIGKLEVQAKTDSNKIIKDSVNFRTTLRNFNSQLILQGKAVSDIQKIMHPLYPLTIHCMVEVDLTGLNSYDSIQFNNYQSVFFHSKDTMYAPEGFQIQILQSGNQHRISYTGHEISDCENCSKSFTYFDHFINQFLPSVEITVCKKRTERNESAECTGWQIYYNKLVTYSKYQNVSYDWDIEFNRIIFTFSFTPDASDTYQSNIYSVLDCEGGAFSAKLTPFSRSKNTSLLHVSLECGTSHRDKFEFSLRKNKWESDPPDFRTYTVPITKKNFML